MTSSSSSCVSCILWRQSVQKLLKQHGNVFGCVVCVNSSKQTGHVRSLLMQLSMSGVTTPGSPYVAPTSNIRRFVHHLFTCPMNPVRHAFIRPQKTFVAKFAFRSFNKKIVRRCIRRRFCVERASHKYLSLIHI